MSQSQCRSVAVMLLSCGCFVVRTSPCFFCCHELLCCSSPLLPIAIFANSSRPHTAVEAVKLRVPSRLVAAMSLQPKMKREVPRSSEAGEIAMLLFSVVVLCCCAVAVGHPSNFAAIVFHGGRQRSGLVPSHPAHLVPGRPLRLRACRFQLLLSAPVIFSKFCTCLFSNQSFFEFDHYMSLLRRSKQGLLLPAQHFQ